MKNGKFILFFYLNFLVMNLCAIEVTVDIKSTDHVVDRSKIEQENTVKTVVKSGQANIEQQANLEESKVTESTVDVTKTVDINQDFINKQVDMSDVVKDLSIVKVTDSVDMITNKLLTEAMKINNTTQTENFINKMDIENKLSSYVKDKLKELSSKWISPEFDFWNFNHWVEYVVRSIVNSVGYVTKAQLIDVSAAAKEYTNQYVNSTVQTKIEAEAQIEEAQLRIERVKKLADIRNQINILSDLISNMQEQDLVKAKDEWLAESWWTSARTEKYKVVEKVESYLLDMKKHLEDLQKDELTQSQLIKDSEPTPSQKLTPAQARAAIEMCIDRMNDPNDTTSLSKTIADISEFAKNLDPIVDVKALEAIQYFIDHADGLMSNASTFYNKSTDLNENRAVILDKNRQYAEQLPMSPGRFVNDGPRSKIDVNQLVSKGRLEGRRVEAEQAQSQQSVAVVNNQNNVFAVA